MKTSEYENLISEFNIARQKMQSEKEQMATYR
jgi:hypothetical protein